MSGINLDKFFYLFTKITSNYLLYWLTSVKSIENVLWNNLNYFCYFEFFLIEKKKILFHDLISYVKMLLMLSCFWNQTSRMLKIFKSNDLSHLLQMCNPAQQYRFVGLRSRLREGITKIKYFLVITKFGFILDFSLAIILKLTKNKIWKLNYSIYIYIFLFFFYFYELFKLLLY